jgi:hypothetical protein
MKDQNNKVYNQYGLEWNICTGSWNGMPNGVKTKINISVRYRKLGLGLVGTGMNILNIFSLTYRTGHVKLF